MNELIEELTRQIQEGKINFGAGILLACKAQRNACVREFRRYSKVHEYKISENWARAISMSKIERQDYEQI